MPESQAVCPRCHGYGRIGNSPSDPNSRMCDLCRGRGWFDHGAVPTGPAAPGPFSPGEAWALTRLGARSSLTALFALVVVALPIVTVVIVVTWWSASHEMLRSLLEVLPASVVARSADGSGQPWMVGGIVVVVTAVVAAVLSRARRRALAASVRPRLDAHGLGLARAVALVAGIGLAATAGPIADGADLRTDPTVFASPWHIAFVLALVLTYAVIGTRRLALRLFVAEHPDLVDAPVAEPREDAPTSPPPPPPAPPTFVDPDTGRPLDP